MAGGQLGRRVPALHRTVGSGDRRARHRRRHLLHRQPAGALLLPRPLYRCAAGHVRHPSQLLARDHRPVAQESVVASDVRKLVGGFPGTGHRTHRPAGGDGREPGGVAGGVAAGRARRDGHPRRHRHGDRDRPGTYGDRGEGRRVAADHPPGHRCRAAAGRCPHVVRGEPRQPGWPRRPHRRCRNPARGRGGLDPPGAGRPR